MSNQTLPPASSPPAGQSTTPDSGGIIHMFARHPVAANLLMITLIILGSYSLIKLNRQFFPNFALDFVTVRVIWPGASAEDVEQSITVPLEQALRNIDGAKEMTSTSTRGFSTIVIEFEEDSDMGIALDDVKQEVTNVRNLPTDSEDPVVAKIARYESVATIILTAEGELGELRPLAYQFERELLNKGIARVNFSGMPEQEIAIEVSAKKLQQLGLSLTQIGDRIVSQSQDIPAGTVAESESAREVRSLQRKRDVQEFATLDLITDRSGQKLTLEDIADIYHRPKENQVEIFYKGMPAILMHLQRTENADALKSAEIMDEWLTQTRQTLTPAVKLVVFDEAYSLIQQRIDLLVKNGVGGLVLVLIILYIFLNGRVAFWVAVGIPTSFLGALGVLYFMGGSINMISLFGLIMALGIIVDDAIVVAEDSLAHYQSGENSLMAAEGGAIRMLAPVMSSSMTTVAAFFPLMLVSGIIGSILFDIPFVVICVIIASLIESFLILPGHLRHSFHKHHHKKNTKLRQKLEDGFNNFRENIFRPLIISAIDNRFSTLTIAICALVLAVSLVVFSQVKFQFFPQPESTVVIASVKFSAGTPPENVHAFASQLEQRLRETDEQLREDKSLIKAAVLRLNTASFDGGRNYQNGNQYAMLQVELLQPDERDIRNDIITEEWESRLTLPAGVEQLTISSPRGGPPGRDIDVFLSGADAIILKYAAEELSEELKNYEGLTNILDDLPYGRQQYIFELTPLAKSANLTITEVGRQLRAALDGQLLQVFYDTNEEIEVRIMLPANERKFHRILETMPIITPSGNSLLLSNVVTLESQQGLELLRHTDTKMGVHVTAEVNAKVTNAKEVLEKLQSEFIPALNEKYGLEASYKGRAEEEKETSNDMKQGGMLALVMIYIILAWVFASYTWPLAVMMVIPFGICGAIFGHWFTGIDLTILSQFGMFGLSGIVINDSIILVTFYKQLRAKGLETREALIESACLRLRAVLLTSLTTIAGLTPLLFETSMQAQFLIPMATSISFGLAFSTLLVLFVLPVFLSYIEQFSSSLKGQE
jgi:multidrug efflux pump subunit AcrB